MRGSVMRRSSRRARCRRRVPRRRRAGPRGPSSATAGASRGSRRGRRGARSHSWRDPSAGPPAGGRGPSPEASPSAPPPRSPAISSPGTPPPRSPAISSPRRAAAALPRDLLSRGHHDRHRREQQVEDRARVMAQAAVAGAQVRARHARDEQRRAAERKRRVGRVERLQAAVAERRARAEDPGPGSRDGRVPAELRQAVVQRGGHRDRLAVGATERRSGGEVARQQAVLAQLRHHARVASGQRAARGLDIAEACLRSLLCERPCERGELAVQREHGDGLCERQLRGIGGRVGVAFLDRAHGVLEARVVELHDVRARCALAVQAAAEVHVDDVRAARAEPQLDGFDVHDELVAGLRRADKAEVRDRSAALAADLDRKALLHRVGRAGVQHRGAPQPEHASSSS